MHTFGLFRPQLILQQLADTMGSCQSQRQLDEHDGVDQPSSIQAPQRDNSNPFYEQDFNDLSHDQILGKYKFHSHYNDQFMGKCSVLEEKTSGNLYLCKQLHFTDEEEMKGQLDQLKRRQTEITSENVIQVRQAFSKITDGFFSDKHRVIIIIDYPFMNFQKQIVNRTQKQISFTKEEAMNFVTSAIRGYASIERSGFKTDKVRLRNIFVGIRNKQPIIKVAETNLIAPQSNYESMINKGPFSKINRDIYLSPQQFAAWSQDDEEYRPHKKSGVFSLGMSFLDICIMDPSRQSYAYSEKRIDSAQIKHRIEIAGKKYGMGIQKLLKEMLEFDLSRRPSFSQLQEKLPVFNKNLDSRMSLSVIPSQRSNYMVNDNRTLRSSNLFKSVVSDSSEKGSRVFKSRIKPNKYEQEELQTVIEQYTNGNKYTGQKKGTLKHGKGKYQFKDGTYYDGQWFENKISGVGNLYFPNGDIEYSGEWRNDEYNGWGTLYCQNENWKKYEGEFKNGVRQGRGKMEFFDGSMYDGEFRGGKICGRGRKICSNGEVIDKYWDTVSPNFFATT